MSPWQTVSFTVPSIRSSLKTGSVFFVCPLWQDQTSGSCMFLLHLSYLKSWIAGGQSLWATFPIWSFILASPEGSVSLLSEEHVFIGDEAFHHKSLVSDVIQRRHGVQLGSPHQRRTEHNAQVLAGHQVLLLVLGHPVKWRGLNRKTASLSWTLESFTTCSSRRVTKFKPLEVSHEVSQRLQVSRRQQLQGLMEGLQTFFRVGDLCTKNIKAHQRWECQSSTTQPG